MSKSTIRFIFDIAALMVFVAWVASAAIPFLTVSRELGIFGFFSGAWLACRMAGMVELDIEILDE